MSGWVKLGAPKKMGVPLGVPLRHPKRVPCWLPSWGAAENFDTSSLIPGDRTRRRMGRSGLLLLLLLHPANIGRTGEKQKNSLEARKICHLASIGKDWVKDVGADRAGCTEHSTWCWIDGKDRVGWAWRRLGVDLDEFQSGTRPPELILLG